MVNFQNSQMRIFGWEIKVLANQTKCELLSKCNEKNVCENATTVAISSNRIKVFRGI